MQWRRSLRWAPRTIINSITFRCVPLIYRLYEFQCFDLSSVFFLSSLIGEMEGKEREREEN